MSLSTEAVQSAALSLQSIHHVHGGHGLPLGVLGVGDSIADHILQENLQHAPRRSDRRYASLRHGEPGGGWRAW